MPEIINHGSSLQHPEIQKSHTSAKIKHFFKRLLQVLVVVLLILIGSQYFNASKFPAQVQVISEDRIGVNPTDEKMDFGDLPRGKASVRVVNLENAGSLDNYVLVWKRGEIAELIKLSNNNFTLEKKSKTKLEFRLAVPESAENRYYKGSVVIFKFPKLW